MSNTRPLRLCDTCLVVDDHPRHVYGKAGARSDDPAESVLYTDNQRRQVIDSLEPGNAEAVFAAMRDLEDRATQMKHLDCCVTDGCPDGRCNRRQADPDDPFDGGKTVGPALIKKLEARVATLNGENN